MGAYSDACLTKHSTIALLFHVTYHKISIDIHSITIYYLPILAILAFIGILVLSSSAHSWALEILRKRMTEMFSSSVKLLSFPCCNLIIVRSNFGYLTIEELVPIYLARRRHSYLGEPDISFSSLTASIKISIRSYIVRLLQSFFHCLDFVQHASCYNPFPISFQFQFSMLFSFIIF